MRFDTCLKNRYPDVLIIFLPFNHGKYLPRKFVPNLIKQIVIRATQNAPVNSKIFFIPTFSEYESKRTVKYYINRRYQGLLATDAIDKLNHLLFRILKPDLLKPSGKVFSFVDLVQITRQLDQWSIDGVHMQPLWYQIEMSMFLETFCNSVQLDSF